MYRFRPFIASLAVIAGVASTLPTSAANVAFFSFDSDIFIEDVSADGSIIVGYEGPFAAFPVRALRWRLGEKVSGLDVVSYDRSAGVAISGNGKVVGGFVIDADRRFRGFKWAEDSGFELIGDQVNQGGVAALSFDGTVAVGSTRLGPYERFAYRWSAATGVETLGDLPGGNLESDAWSVSDDGTIVVGVSSVDRGVAPFRWTVEEGMVQLPTLLPSRPFGSALGISPDGSTIAGTSLSDRGAEAVIWKDSEITILGQLAEEGRPIAVDVSNGGTVVVGSQSRQLQGDSTAFRWTQRSGMKSIASLLTMGGVDMTGWQLLGARKVSSDGTVLVGYGIDPSGNRSDYVAILPVDFVPEPSSAMLIVIAVCSVASYRRKFAAGERERV
jgi:uncharacterized membrane protein